MKVGLDARTAGLVRGLGNYYQRKPSVLGPTRPSDEQIVSYAIGKLHEEVSKQSDWDGAQAGSTGGINEMQYAVQQEQYAGFVTLSLHDSASDAQAAWDRKFGFDAQARGRIVEVGAGSICSAGAVDSRTAVRVIQSLGYER